MSTDVNSQKTRDDYIKRVLKEKLKYYTTTKITSGMGTLLLHEAHKIHNKRLTAFILVLL